MTCAECRAYLQAKVDVLDLFRTLWGLVESPRATLRRIALARHKNHATLLSALAGVTALGWYARYRQFGDRFDDPLMPALIILGLGPPAGIAAVLLIALAVTGLGRVQGGRASFRDTRALTAYATAPIVVTMVVVLPAHLAVFGMDLFRSTPHPMVISPVPYLILTGIETLAAAWSWVLLARGAAMANGVSGRRALILTAMLALLTAGALAPVLFR